ncbi:MAG: exopolysaccharide biosynthesis polyprenyl glycosylphosphotransferase [Solirubrobacteraceae bacterium]
MRREQVYRRLLANADAIAALAAVILATRLLGQTIRWPILALPPFVILVAKIQGLYDRDEMVIRKSTIAEWRALLEATTIVSICIYLSWRVLTTATRGPGMRLFLLLVVSMTPTAIIARTLGRLLARRVTPDERCLIVGDVDRCAHLAETIASVDGVELIGEIASDQLDGSLADLRKIVTDLDLHRLVIAPHTHSSDTATLNLVRSAKLLGVRVSILPSVLAAVGGCAAFDELDGHTLLGVPRFGLTRSSCALKRSFDLIGSAASIAVLSPLLLAIGILIRLDSPGPIVFRQSRIGREGWPFPMLKFRSMVDGADAMKDNLLSQNEACDGLFKIADDPRVTRVGRLLRTAHLDEMPQLFNVLRGEMSLVGPRPLVPAEDHQIAGTDRIRLSLTPGITGPWQICGPMTTPLSEMVKLDYLYISNWSLWRDVDILLKTAIRIVDRGGH